ncbi:zinc-finger domain-containing protein [Candidimonas sp. SYP-B2681]|uniref:zinc-finger domain-containing protein n=1 Tax=Candidimonas sp. SYP-B2681 TaxID=2497686 RepID=UPI000F86C401|nr:zinc-finger domain-containing protein [Candidimonas sp. SYP-B2681]RTZ42310.1 zinc-finger domain-containing protein [Candidimonas sp. SYP-B2681]
MSSAPTSDVPKDQTIFVEAKDLPLYCPRPGTPLWSMHPRVFIEVVKTGRALCPYCGAAYELKEGEKAHGH